MSKAGRTPGRRARAYAYTAVTTAIVLLFALAEWAAERYVSGLSRAASLSIEIAILFAATLAFRPIHQRVEAAIEEAFNKRKHEALSTLAKFRRDLSSFKDLSQLLRRVIEAVEHHLEAPACAIYLRREQFRAEASSFDVAAGDIEESDPLIIRLRSSGAPAQPNLLKSNAQGTHAFPMTAAGELVGFLLVHCKHAYDDDELQMLTGLAQDLAVALVAIDPKLRPQSVSAPNNLPANLPPLFGRDREIGEIRAALAQARLLTLTGTGGVGKTSLALHAASQELPRHQDGARFIDLAPITSGSLIVTTMLQTLDAGPAEQGTEQQTLIDFLKPRDVLLVVDNCEQVASDVAKLFAQVLANCPGVTLLATSRELLHVDGEQVYRLGPLRADAAAELFVQRAAAIAPQFDPKAHESAIYTICERLDGIPLAIELAAARVRALSPGEIAAHLDERFRLLTSSARSTSERQRTLAATIEWSFGLLTEEEQSLFRRLSAFRGSFTLAAAAAVCAQGGLCDEFHVLDVLTSLSDKSLLTAQIALTTRYRLLETIREFAVQKAIEQQAESIARDQHAAYFASLAAQAYHEFDTRLPQGWLDRLAPDIDNFRAALEWTLDGPGDRHTGAQMAADCGPIFLRLQLLAEGLYWCDKARNVPTLAPATAGRIEYAASMMHNNLAQLPFALACAERAVTAYRESSDRRGLAQALSQVAQQYARAGDSEKAAPFAEEAIEAARALAEPRMLISVLRRCAFSLPSEQMERARTLFKEALDVAESSSEPDEMCRILDWWADREAVCGNLEHAIELASRALKCSDDKTQMYLESQIASWALALGKYDEAEPHARRALALASDSNHDYVLALSIVHCSAFHSRHDAEQAALLFGYGNARLKVLAWQPRSDDRAAVANAAASIVRRLRSDEFRNLVERGAALSDGDAIHMLADVLAGSRNTHNASVDGGGDRVGTLLR